MSVNKQNMLYAARLLLEYAGGRLPRLNLMKGLFYLDLEWLLEKGETFTGATWVALENGPVVEDYKVQLVRPLLDAADVEERKVVSAPFAGVPKVLVLREPPVQPEDEHLELVARRVATFVSDPDVDISAYTHENPAWIEAYRAGPGTRIDMVLAMLQVQDEDPWLNEPFTEEERSRIDQGLTKAGVPL